MSIFKKEIDKIGAAREQQAHERQDKIEQEEYTAWKGLNFTESDKLRETDFKKWLKFTEMEVKEGN